MSMLVIQGLVKSFGAAPVLEGLELTIPDGEFAAVLGASGCGKTTLLRLVAGFERAEAGEIEIGGRTVAGPGTHVRPERRRVGIVPQEGALFPHLSVARNVAFGLSREERAKGVAETLELVGLSGYGDRMPHELSGGQQQRVAVARALAPRPALVLLDEPFNALDPGLRGALREEVREVLREAGMTAMLVTHDQEEALSTADRVALLRDGRIVQEGSPRTVYERPCDISAAGFLGETVLVPGVLRDGGVECALGVLAPVPGIAANGETRGMVVLRPEQLVLDRRAGLVAEVKESRFLGHDTVTTLVVSATGTEIRARLRAYPPPDVGTTVRVRVAGEVVFFPGR